MKYRVRYLLSYPDVSRWGATDCVNVKCAQQWISGAKRNRNFLELQVYIGPKLLQHWKRDNANRLQRCWQGV